MTLILILWILCVCMWLLYSSVVCCRMLAWMVAICCFDILKIHRHPPFHLLHCLMHREKLGHWCEPSAAHTHTHTHTHTQVWTWEFYLLLIIIMFLLVWQSQFHSILFLYSVALIRSRDQLMEMSATFGELQDVILVIGVTIVMLLNTKALTYSWARKNDDNF